MDAQACPGGQEGAPKMVEGWIRRKSKSVSNGGGHTARWHHLADAGKHDLGRVGETAVETFPQGEMEGRQEVDAQG